MLHRITIVLALALTLVVTSTAGAFAWEPNPGAHFNNPWGKRDAALVKTFVRAVDHARPGSTIRIATYSNNRKDMADALIKAYRRGVHVQMLVNDNTTSSQTMRIQRVVGHKIGKRSFLRICRASCRGRRGNLHVKFYLFSHTGTAHDVTMVGSANLTNTGVHGQFNDIYTVRNNPPVQGTFVNVFNQMKQDRATAHPFRVRNVGGYQLEFYPRYNNTKGNDRVMRRLNGVRCKGAPRGTGLHGRTMIRIAMYGWNAQRGVYTARKVASLARSGCNVRVIVSAVGGTVLRILKRAGIVVHSASADRNRNGVIDLYSHLKYMALSGRYGGGVGWHVWTGSSNWSSRTLYNDDLTMHIPGRSAFRQYRHNFNYIWTYRSTRI